jgi:hypothetical protein
MADHLRSCGMYLKATPGSETRLVLSLRLLDDFTPFFQFASDDLNGTSNYGLYAQSLTSSNAFSVPFASRVKDDLQYMFMTGDRTSWLVVLRQQLGISTGLGSISLAPVASSASSCMFHEIELSVIIYRVLLAAFVVYLRIATREDPTIFVTTQFISAGNDVIDKIYRLFDNLIM